MSVVNRDGNVVSALLNKEITVLLHVCNCQGKFRSGIAKEIRERIPDAYTQYMKGSSEMGSLSFGAIEPGNLRLKGFASGVCNMVAQENYGFDGKRYLHYGALALCLQEVATQSIAEEDIIGIPYFMGSALAGGDWGIVKELVESILKGFNIVYYKL